jgi:predicted HNH restriction endonuclease
VDAGEHAVKPVIGKAYTWKQVEKDWHGEVTFLAKREGKIVCATLVASQNPEAPQALVVGTKPRNMRRAEEYCEQGGVIPVFMKYSPNEWVFKGFFELESFTTDQQRLAKYKRSPTDELTRVIFLRQVRGGQAGSTDLDIPLEFTGKEGKRRWQAHLRRERDPKVVMAKKRQYRALTGGLKCEACTFDFDAAYGLSEFCEVHHLVPLAEGEQERTTRLEDLAVLCSNCHRAIHRLGPPMPTVVELKRLVERNRAARN